MLSQLGLFGDILALLVVLVGFNVVVFFHELGHYAAAIAVGVKCERFALGFGKRLIGFRRGEGITFGRPRTYNDQRPAPANLGECDFCLNLLPLGGYVKMLGQEDFVEQDEQVRRTRDPRSFHAKSIRARMLVISAGVLMNVVFGLLVFMVVYMIGRESMAPVVGAVLPGSPAARAGIQPDDRILRINGKNVRDFSDLARLVAFAPPGETSELVLQRDEQTITLNLEPEESAINRGRVRIIGVEPASSNRLVATALAPDDDPLAPALRPGDRIVAVRSTDADTGQTIDRPIRTLNRLTLISQSMKGQPLDLVVERTEGGQTEQIVVRRRPALLLDAARQVGSSGEIATDGRTGGHLLGMIPRSQILLFAYDAAFDLPTQGARDAGLRSGDVLIGLDGLVNPTTLQAEEHLKVNRGRQVTFRVFRPSDQREHAVSLTADFPAAKLGVMLHIADSTGEPVVAGVVREYVERVEINKVRSRDSSELGPRVPTPAAAAGIEPGFAIVAVDGEPVANWLELAAGLLARASPTEDSSVNLTIRDRDANTRDLPLRLPRAGMPYAPEARARSQPEPLAWNSAIHFAPLLIALPQTTTIQAANPLTAASLGVSRTIQMLQDNYIGMRRMFVDQTVSVRNMSSPVGIFAIGKIAASQSFSTLLFFLAVLSIGLAVVNFMPVPPLDGGHMVFLVLEWIRRKPVPLGLQIGVTLISLAGILLILLLLVTKDVLELTGAID